MKKFIALLPLLISCAPNTERVTIKADDGLSIVMKKQYENVICQGTRLFYALDANRNGVYDAGDIPQTDMVVCNGLDGVSPSVTLMTSSTCPSGGVTLTVNNSSEEICNGSVGPAGPSGLPGKDADPVEISVTNAPSCSNGGKTVTFSAAGTTLNTVTTCNGLDGLPGQSVSLSQSTSCVNGGVKLTSGSDVKEVCNGSPGSTTVINGFQPVKLCSGSASREYGIKVGNDLYAVYHDRTNNYAFLSLIVPGQYITTDQSDCRFQVNADGSTTYVSGGNSLVAVTPPALAGSCVVTKIGNNYTFTLTGVTFDNSASLTIQKSGALTVNSDNRGNWTITQTNPQWKALVTNTGVNPFTLYTTGNGNFTSAVIERLGQTLTCSGLPN